VERFQRGKLPRPRIRDRTDGGFLSFAYSHALSLSSLQNGIDILAFANRFEFPASERFVFGFNVNIRLSSFGGFDNGNQDLVVGPECAVYFSPRMALRAVLLYDNYFSSASSKYAKLNDYATLNVSLDARF
jgi:hypothetical protein